MPKIIQLQVPKKLRPGEEVVIPTIVMPKNKVTRRVEFHWGDDSIKVLGAYMVAPNVFEFPPSKEEKMWYLKFAVSSSAIPSSKATYVTVHEVFYRKWIVLLFRLLAILIFLISFALLISSSLRNILSQLLSVSIGVGRAKISIPVSLILLIIFWSNKFSTLIRRLTYFKLETKYEYHAKTFHKGTKYSIRIVPRDYKKKRISPEEKEDELTEDSNLSGFNSVYFGESKNNFLTRLLKL